MVVLYSCCLTREFHDKEQVRYLCGCNLWKFSSFHLVWWLNINHWEHLSIKQNLVGLVLSLTNFRFYLADTGQPASEPWYYCYYWYCCCCCCMCLWVENTCSGSNCVSILIVDGFLFVSCRSSHLFVSAYWLQKYFS